MFNSTSSKVRKQILGLFKNRWAIGCLLILLFQQILEASSTFWLVGTVERISNGGNFFPFLALYLCSLVIPYIPWCIAYIVKCTWKQQAEISFIETFIATNKNHLSEWGNKSIKEEKLSIVTTEGPNTLHLLIDYIFDLTGYVLSVFLNIFALSMAVEPMFAVAYGFSLIVNCFVIRALRKKQRALTQSALAARVGLCKSLLASWDNVLLGNEYNFKLWVDKAMKRMQLCLQRNVESERFNQVLAIFISLLTSIPCLSVVVYYTIAHQDDRAHLATFIVTLPLLFMILSYTYQTLNLAFKWTMHRSKFAAIYRAIQKAPDTIGALESKVQWNKMATTLSSNGHKGGVCMAIPKEVRSPEQLMELAKNRGRFTIRGENGAGKSTALMLVKKAFVEKSFFLPTHHQLSFALDSHYASTGESLRSRLEEILKNVHADILLLDEWDANLDVDNRSKLSDLIDDLAEKKCVIEVRHR